MTRRLIRISGGTLLALLLLAGILSVSRSRLSGPVLAQSDHSHSDPALEHAMQLSSAFRRVARQTLPALVSIETTGRVVRETVRRGVPFGDDELLKRFFGNDPRLKPFFEQGPDGGMIERERRLPGGRGSGFLISADGVVMTNTHVVRDAEEVTVRLADGREFTVGHDDILMDRRSDVAIVRIHASEPLPYVPLGNDEEMEIGDWVLALGSPFGLHRTVTQGIISAKGRGLTGSRMVQEFLQTDAAINPGNSGGPLVNLRGEVIGINTAISTASGGYDGVGFAIPVGKARWVAEQLLEKGVVERGFLGIEMQPIDADLAKHFQLKVPRGIVVTRVIPDSAADRAGFQVGDVILQVNGRDILTDHNMLTVVEQLRVGETYPVLILRNDKRMELRITVAARPRDEELAESVYDGDGSPASPDTSKIDRLGIRVQNVTPEVAENLNIAASGVLVTEVEAGSGADRAGLEPGMVISRAGSVSVSDIAGLKAAVEKADEDVLLLVQVPTGSGRFISRFVLVKLQ